MRMLLVVLLSIVAFADAQCFSSQSNVNSVPATSVGPTLEQGGYYHVGSFGTTSNTSSVYWATDGVYNFMFLVYDSGIVVFNAPPGRTRFVAPAIATYNSSKKVTHIIYTTSHLDHIGDAYSIYTPGVTVIASQYTASTLQYRKRETNSSVPLPTITFTDYYYNFTVGVTERQVISLIFRDSSATSGSISVFLPQSLVLMSVDLAVPTWVPTYAISDLRDPRLVLLDFNFFLSVPFTSFVGGRPGLVGSYSDIVNQYQYVYDVINISAKYYYQSPNYTDYDPAANYLLYQRTTNAQLSCSCATELITKWGSTLAGVGVYADTHCARMLRFISADGYPFTTYYPQNEPRELIPAVPITVVKCTSSSLVVTFALPIFLFLLHFFH